MSLPCTLKVGGVEVNLATDACEVGALRRGYSAPFQLTLRRSIAFDDTGTWENEAAVELQDGDSTVRFKGRIKTNDREASVSQEAVTYTCLGLRNQVSYHTFRRSISGSTRCLDSSGCSTARTASRSICSASRSMIGMPNS